MFGVFFYYSILIIHLSTKSFCLERKYCAENTPKVNFNRNTSGVIFNLDVTYDRALSRRINNDGLIVLMKTVHRKFDRLGLLMFGQTSNNAYIPFVVAKFNRELPKTSNPIRLTIIVDFSGKVDNMYLFVQHLTHLFKITNAIFPNTIDTVLVQEVEMNEKFVNTFKNFRVLLEKENEQHKLFRNFGLIVNALNFFKLKLGEIRNISEFMPMKMLLMEPVDIIYISLITFSSATGNYNETIAELNSLFGTIANVTKSRVRLGLFPAMWDKDSKNARVSQEKRFTSLWQAINRFGEEMKIPILFGKAFDSPLRTPVETSNSGWWRLIPDVYKSSADFKFEDKLCYEDVNSITTFDNVNITWLKGDMHFDRKYVGVIEYPDIWLKVLRKYGGLNFSKLLETISSKFSILVVHSGTNIYNFETEAIARFNVGREKNKREILEAILLLRHDHPLDQVVKHADTVNQVAPGTIQRIIFCTYPDEKDGIWGEKIISAYNTINDSLYFKKYKWGVCVSVADCTENLRKEIQNFDFVVMRDFPSRKREIRVETEARRVQSLFDSCQSRFNETKMMFWSGWRTEKETDYLDLLKFWEMMSEWAGKRRQVIIFSTAFDNPLEHKRDSTLASGWWWRLENATELEFKSKQEIALALALKAQQVLHLNWNWKLPSALVVFSLFFLFAFAITFDFIGKRAAKYLTSKELQEFFNGSQSNGDAEGKAYKNTFYEVGKSSFRIKELLDSGTFGKVFNGTVTKNNIEFTVAIKTAKENCPKVALKGLLSEIKVLSYLGKHVNVVELVGAYTAELKKSVLYLFVELCGLGCLESYLRNIQSEMESAEENEQTILSIELEKDMKKWAWEIANGLEFITSKNVVHMDIATRNVLLTCNKIAKISDFGLSRRLYNFEIYFKSQQEPFPWRWMSPEALLRCEFTEKSDVWAFGITLWEIFSLGDIPYSNLEWDVNFANYLKIGLRLGTPRFNLDGVHLIISRCWLLSPEPRPTFSMLKVYLDELQREQEIPDINDENDDSNYDELL